MDFKQFSQFANQNSIDFDKLAQHLERSITVSGTFVQGSELYIENARLNLEFKDKKWILTAAKQKRVLYESKGTEIKFVYNLSYIYFEPDVFFYASSAVELAKIALILSIIQNLQEVPFESEKVEKSIVIVLISNSDRSRFALAYKKVGKELVLPFLNVPKTGKIFVSKQNNKYLISTVLPFVGVEESPESEIQPCYYDSKLPEEIYSPNYQDALIQGIISLSNKIGEDRLKLEKPKDSPLEIARLEFAADNDKIRHNIEVEAEKLKREAISGSIFDSAMSELEKSIAHRINFGGSAAITGKEAASLLRKLQK